MAFRESNTANMANFISVGEALKLVAPFKGDKRDVLAFIVNVDTAFGVSDAINAGILFKFVLTRIIEEPRTAIAHRNLENWEKLKKFLNNTFSEKGTLDYHDNQLLNTK